ncbi:hypothetical protein CIHG_06899 [Coccidioides immitis H538.4]|uniref:Uncharacterized protein n=2 Tax=Coccidioides immitis TaxID=5501 RepID=A0A0J8RVP3_COCIT|nr:hypothetical protein CIRG_09412 [Coccidioides immitis RMSCC 2394]KMU89230.1 hypothetical protein CIHG_06899 [Coccidioides immitis H538.4]
MLISYTIKTGLEQFSLRNRSLENSVSPPFMLCNCPGIDQDSDVIPTSTNKSNKGLAEDSVPKFRSSVSPYNWWTYEHRTIRDYIAHETKATPRLRFQKG